MCKIFGPKIWSFKFFDKFHVWVNEQLVNQHQYQHWKKVEGGSGGGGDTDPKKESSNDEADDLKQLKSCVSKL